MRIVLLKLARMLVFCCGMSLISCSLYYFKIIKNTVPVYSAMLAITFAIFLLDNIFMLRWCYKSTGYKKRVYYLYNYAAYGIFMLITAVVYRVFGNTVYALLFNTLKLATFLRPTISVVQSTAISHLIMVIIIAIMPLAMLKKKKAYLAKKRNSGF